jgi:cytochrome oxidase Cu insertion factor (SCO1/SenC/PrrC family)
LNRRRAALALPLVPLAQGVLLPLALVPGAPARAAQFEPGKGLVNAPRQDFVAPPPGSYELPPIQAATDGWVLDGSVVPRRLSRYTQGALTMLSFVYTYCVDPVGCPLAYETFVALRARVLAEPRLKGRVRLVSLSFDPSHDTPALMQQYGGEYARSRELPWAFLTTSSLKFLQPILEGFGQDVEVAPGVDGQPGRVVTHMLKVFLIDERGRVREIYSAAFLHLDVMVNDLLTLAQEARSRAP